jgi:AcrR family transcriptional regulator
MSYFIQLKTTENISLRDPNETELGRKIISKSIYLIDKIGFEEFNFKKLANEIDSTQASIYRYFENKHKLLLYLSSWYWSWLEFIIKMNCNNIQNPKEKLDIIIRDIAQLGANDPNIPHVNESALYRIVVSESSKAFLTKNIDKEVNKGYFSSYTSLCLYISNTIKEVNPNYPYARTLASNLIETAHEQIFFAEHFPEVTNLICAKNSQVNEKIEEFLQHLVHKLVY